MSKCTFSTSPSIKRYLFIYLFEKDKCLQIFQYIIIIIIILIIYCLPFFTRLHAVIV